MGQRADVEGDLAALKAQTDRALDLAKALNEVSSQVRKGEVDPQLLGRLGLTAEAMRKAGEAFDKSRTENRKIGELSREEGGGEKAPADTRPGEQVHKGATPPAAAGSAQARSGDLPSDAGRERDVSTYDISPEYRRIVERYRAEISEK